MVIEAIQFVYFGGIFQKINSFLFGFLVFGIISIVFVLGVSIRSPDQLKTAFRQPGNLTGLNVTATLAWACYLTSVQLIEPAVVYTISAGVMPVSAYLAHRFGFSGGNSLLNKTEMIGMLLVLGGIGYLSAITMLGLSGFVRGDQSIALIGILLAIADGVFFTMLIIFCQKLDKSGVGPSAVFGLRFPLYVIVAGGFALNGISEGQNVSSADLGVIVLLGLLLTVPHLYALQKAVTKVSTPVISALTTLGPFVIFVLQIIEGRVDYSHATLFGLFIYFTGSCFSVAGSLAGGANQNPNN